VKVPEKVPEKAPEPVKQRVRPIGVDPDFRDFANRLPAFEAEVGREFIIVAADDIYQGVTSAAQQIRNEQFRRGTRVDPHNLPFLQINPALLPIAIVIGVAEGGVLLALAAPAIIAAGAAIAEFVVASATAATEAVASRVALRWAVTRITQAGAAALVPRLINGGMSFAQSVVAVQPLVNKRVTAIADVTGTSLEGATGGQAVTIGGDTYRTIMRLTSRKF
jgi:hypothetical protein